MIPILICRGQIWRLLTWVLMPPSELSIFTVIMLFFYYWIARTLANTWGDFYFNIYILGGILITDIGMMIAYPILLSMDTPSALINIQLMKMFVTTYYIQTSILLAFAFTYPNAQVLLYFVIPIKMSWLGIFEAIMLVFLLQCGYGNAAPGDRAVGGELCDLFPLYQGPSQVQPEACGRRAGLEGQVTRAGPAQAGGASPVFRRTETAQKFAESGSQTPSGSTSRRSAAGYTKIYPNGARHKCTICGRTELDDEKLEFRYCTKCEGNHEYCQDHLFTHQHIKNGAPQPDQQ